MADNETSIKKPPFYIRHFFGLLVSLGILGGFLALTVPLWESWNFLPFLKPLIPKDSTDYSKPKAIADLRLHILYITGGIIAILTLLQTNWKNQIDRRKVEDDIQKNSNDHTRQVQAERRTRYTKAIEQLADDKAAIRLGGIYTLMGLVDEWLTDESISDSGKRKEEGQTIINNICAYIQSMPENCTENDLKSNNAPKDEANVRQLLFGELKARTKYMENYTEYKNNNETLEQSWEVFKFNFANAPIFYLSMVCISQMQTLAVRISTQTLHLKNHYGLMQVLKTALFIPILTLKNLNSMDLQIFQRVFLIKRCRFTELISMIH